MIISQIPRTYDVTLDRHVKATLVPTEELPQIVILRRTPPLSLLDYLQTRHESYGLAHTI
jgi:hypothetical protein